MSIEYIRAIAAVAVVVWHTGWSRTVLGQSGVDMFFVVSGFIMMLVSRRESSPLQFCLARIVRIVPLYWLVTLVTAWMHPPSAEALVSSLLFWPDHPFPVVIQGWSLDSEMLYYALFAVALLAGARWRLAVLATEMVLLCVVAPAVLPHSQVLTAWTNPLAFEFLAGATLFTVWQLGWVPTGRAAWGLALASAVLLAATVALGEAPPGWMRVVCWGGPALGLVAAGLGIERSGRLPSLGLLGGLGAASYAIYLTHRLVLHLIAGPLVHVWAPVALGPALVAACLVGWVVHCALERPMYRIGKRGLAGMRLQAGRPERRARLAG